jgi:PEP-CTERM/exosortase A-associated glycosyltransferase
VPGAIYVQEMVATAKMLSNLVDSLHPDILHAHSPVLNALPALAVGRRKRIPVVYEVRALWEDAAVDHGSTLDGSVRYQASRALETFALRHADHVTTICDGLRDEIAARGIPPTRITVVPNAVDTDAFRMDGAPDADLRASLGLAGCTVIGFAGSFYAYEGLDLLIEAFAVLAQRRRDLRLVLVGGGRQAHALEQQAARAGVGDKVVFTGRVDHADVQRYYDLIDVLAYPRHRMRLTELVTPLKPLEAMAQGRIVVASDVGGHRELVRDGETGFLFPAEDATALAATLTRVLDARDDWPRVRRTARTFVESERTWSRSVSRYAGVYAALRARHSLTGAPLTHP